MSLNKYVASVIPKGNLARGVGYLVGGTAGAQLLGILCSPIITRLYSPTQFGVLAVFMGVVSVLSSICCLRYERAIPLAEDSAEMANLVYICFFIVTLLTAICAIIVGSFRMELLTLLDIKAYAWIVWAWPITIGMVGVFTILNICNIKNKYFRIIAAVKIRQSFFSNSLKIAGYQLGVSALLFSYISSLLIGIFSLYRCAFKNFGQTRISVGALRQTASKYRRFPLYSAPGATLNSGARSLVPIGLGVLFSAEAAGKYALANQVILAPMTLIGVSVSQVFLSEAQAAYNKGELGRLIIRIQKRLALLGVPILAGLALFGPFAFETLFGSDWRESGVFARYMAPWFLLQFISSPLSIVFSVISKEHLYVIWQVALLVLSGASICLGSYWGAVDLSIIFLSCTGILAYGFLLLWINNESYERVHI